METVLHSFAFAGDGTHPDGALIEGTDGNFYGMTSAGGSANTGNGTVFKLTPAGAETVLYSFAGAPSDGNLPYAVRLLQGSDGNFYGTTEGGGTNNLGIVFRLTAAGIETVLYSFSGGPNDGDSPVGNLIEGSDGSLYGTTAFGGAYGKGSVFKLTPSGTATLLYSFSGSRGDGTEPNAGLTLGSDGTVYGTTNSGGINNQGTFFNIVPP